MKMNSREVVVAGGAGFIGGHLVLALLEQGARVTVLDNFHTGLKDKFSALQEPRLTVVEHDVCEPIDVFSDDFKCDLVINLACPASPAKYQAAPLRTWRTSIFGAVHLADLAQRHGARLVQASTSEVYGDPQVHPQPESYWGHVSCTGPRACYDEGKRAAETYLMDFCRETDLDVRIARVFNTYGPGMMLNDGRVVSNFITQALTGEALTLHGDGLQTRSFCYVSDTVRGFIELCTRDGLGGQVFNIGNPQEHSVRALAEFVSQLTGTKLATATLPAAKDDPRQRCPDITRARTMLDWVPRVPLRDGLSATIAELHQRIG